MYCMKCGRDIEPKQVFCPECLADMEKYPVRPGTAVVLPRRSESAPTRKVLPKRKPPTPEEMIKRLRRVIRVLLCTVLVLIALLGVLVYPHVKELLVGQQLLPGQNYTSSASTTPTGADAP